MNLPNLITICRLVLVPFVVAMIVQKEFVAAFIGFMAAGLSDALDGFIARRFNLRSELGAYLDAIADKALLVSIFVTLAIVGAIPSWLAIVVVFRDVMIIGAVMISWLMGKPVEIKPLVVSKLNTGAQIGFAALVLWSRAFWGGLPTALLDGLVYGVAALTIASAAAYLAQWLKHMTS
jgi:cardiolipin synthase (CMP-forming)